MVTNAMRGKQRRGRRPYNSCRSCSFEQRCHLSKALEKEGNRPCKHPGGRKCKSSGDGAYLVNKSKLNQESTDEGGGDLTTQDDPPHHLFRKRRAQVRPE